MADERRILRKWFTSAVLALSSIFAGLVVPELSGAATSGANVQVLNPNPNVPGNGVISTSAYNPATSTILPGFANLFANGTGNLFLSATLVDGVAPSPPYTTTASAQIDISGPRPVVTATASYDTFSQGTASDNETRAMGVLDYSFTLIGSPSNVRVPVQIDTAVNLFAPQAFATAELTLPTGPLREWTSDKTGQVLDKSIVDLFPGTYTIEIQVHAYQTGQPLLFKNSSFATIDPYITVDPTFANASLYHIVVEDGIGNAPFAVPEPSQWVLILTGITLLCGVTMRRGVDRANFIFAIRFLAYRRAKPNSRTLAPACARSGTHS